MGMPNPSAKYDPEGMAGIINIILKQSADLGTSGGLVFGGAAYDRTNASGNLGYQEGKLTLSDALHILLLRKDLNLAAAIKALQAKSLLEILAEPNVLAINGKQASFVAGGEFPFPTLQGGGGGLGAVTIAFREFGIRLQFLPTVTPRGTIRLQVMPEVSSLDFAHGLTFQGFNIPALATRRIQTEIELETGQSFAIAGLLDNRLGVGTASFNESLSSIFDQLWPCSVGDSG